MRIRTQFIITMLLFGIILVVMATSAIITNQRLEEAIQQESLSAHIAEGASELSYLTDEYLIYREGRQLKRWQSRFASLSEQAAKLKVDIPQQQALVRNMRGNQTRLKEVFDSVISALEGPVRGQSAGLDPALLQVSWSRMAVQGRELVSDASRLSQSFHREMDQLTAARNQLLYIMLALFGVFLLSSYMLTYRRILKSIAKLQTDTKTIGAGNLEFRTEEQENDEIGDLARAFNQMTVNLKAVTASKADLEREMADRKQAEEALRESETKYRNLFTNMAEEVHFWQVLRDGAGRIMTWRLVDANPPTIKAWGKSSVEQIRGKTTDEIFGPGATEHYMPVVQKIMTEGVPHSFEDYFLNLDKHFRFTSVPLGDYFITTGADITDIRKAHAALRESEERWAVTLGSIGDAVIASDTNGRVSFMNQVAEALTGWSLAEAAGKPVAEVFRIVNDQTRAAVDDPVRKVLQTGKIVGLANHTVLLCKGGEEIPIDDSGAPIRDKEGRVLGVVLVFRDITERKRSEALVIQSQKTFFELVESAPFGIYVVDSQFRIAQMNAGSQTGAFRNVRPVIGRDFAEAMRIIWPEPVAAEIIGHFHHTLETGRPYYSPRFINPRHDVETVESYEWELHRMRLPDGQYGVVCYYFDSTKLRAAEAAARESDERLRFALEACHIGAWDFDLVDHTVFRSLEHDRIFGYTQLLSQWTLDDFLKHALPEHRLPVEAMVREATAARTGWTYECPIRRADGETRWIWFSGRYRTGVSGHAQVAGVVQDITDRKRAEEELRQLNETLEQQVAGRTSELQHTVEVLQEEVEQRERAEYELKLANEKLAERADQLRRLAGQLTTTEQAERKRLSRILHDGLQQQLVSAKLQMGGLADQIANADFKQTVDEIEKMIGESVSMSRRLSAELSPPILYEGSLSDGLGWLARWMRDKHRFNVDLSMETVPELCADAKVLLFESARELLFNAFKHAKISRAGVSLEPVDGGGLRLIVSDEGVGFDPCRLRIVGEDGGFGLFSIRERIDLIGGRLDIDSAPGKGSRLALNVPYSQTVFVPPPADGVGALPVSSPQGSMADQTKTIRLLLADDHALFRNGLARLLKHEPGLEIVAQATDGKEAIELAQKLKPDIILMDISMPGVNGIEATRAIHQQYPEIRIIGLSMHEDQERAQAMINAGATDYKTKGCAASELVAAIRGHQKVRES